MYYIYENDKPYKLQDYLKKVRLEGNEIKINEVPK